MLRDETTDACDESFDLRYVLGRHEQIQSVVRRNIDVICGVAGESFAPPCGGHNPF
jgi:hypothetical protein